MRRIGICLLAAAGLLGACQKTGSQLACGGESFRVSFEDKKAMVTAADGGNTPLELLDQPGSGPKVYTNGAMTFTVTEAAGQPPVVRFARGRMAFQDCKAAPAS